ncbi:MAG: hypothetical protein K9K21_01055 [Desulfotignum sp.]|nr:hypothetical protein [Desulfotignum sp.]MCF8112419.1 hypothetical protein [Desulfotignum sp.]MCF8124768.1 hypothetical protein [Desulfotignum sp.]
MTCVFTQKMMLPYSAMGANNHVRLDRILNLFQDAAGIHAHQMGISGFDLAKKNLKWVISRYQIRVHDTLKLKWPQPFELKTWRLPWKNLYELRQFTVVTPEGNTLISALGVWVMVKAINSKPIRLTPHMPPCLMTRTAPDPDLWPNDPDLSVWDHQAQFDIRIHDLDLNQHVNNTVYVTWALETLPVSWLFEHMPQTLVVCFLKETFYPDTVIAKVKLADLTDCVKTCHAIFNKTSGEKLASLTLTWKKIFHDPV